MVVFVLFGGLGFGLVDLVVLLVALYAYCPVITLNVWVYCVCLFVVCDGFGFGLVLGCFGFA